MDSSADADLLRRAQNGDSEASDRLYREFFEGNRQIQNLLQRQIPTPEDREDVLHDAFLALLRSKTEFRGEATLQTFVYRVVYIAVLQKYRSDRTQRRGKEVRLFVEMGGEEHERELAVEDYGFERVESEQMADRMYSVLPEPLRTALRLRVSDDLSYGEIARRMEAPVNTTATRIFKARAILHKLFGGANSPLVAEEQNLPRPANKSKELGN